MCCLGVLQVDTSSCAQVSHLQVFSFTNIASPNSKSLRYLVFFSQKLPFQAVGYADMISRKSTVTVVHASALFRIENNVRAKNLDQWEMEGEEKEKEE